MKELATRGEKWARKNGRSPYNVMDNKDIYNLPFNERYSSKEMLYIFSPDFKFKNFKESMTFVNKVAEIAESESHHPDIYIYYSKVKLELSTHAVGGLSINDFIVASKIDALS